MNSWLDIDSPLKPAQHNNSLDRSVGGVFLNLFDAAKLGRNHRARSTVSDVRRQFDHFVESCDGICT